MTTRASRGGIPQPNELMNPTLRVLRRLGGSASNDELSREVPQDLGLAEQITSIIHGNGPYTEVEYRLAWARTALKREGLINNSRRGIWSLTDLGRATEADGPSGEIAKVRREIREPYGPGGDGVRPDISDDATLDTPDAPNEWQDRLLAILKAMDPGAFERLCQRVLRESGFVEVNVTGKSGDGGIDGVGTIRFADLISFPVVFQCKRWNSIVASSVVRDFRGAMAGRADRGIIITTSAFTRDAYWEASRAGVPPIDLIDGEKLVNKVKELGLGVKTEMVEQVTIESAWFHQI